jgi:hypothetical protein
MDDTYMFFQNCYHLKDWLKNDPTFGNVKKTKQEIEDYVTNTPCLALCADICNGTKHLVLDRSPRSGDIPKHEDFFLKAYEGGPRHGEVSYTLVIEHQGTKRDALSLARECVTAWKAFIS